MRRSTALRMSLRAGQATSQPIWGQTRPATAGCRVDGGDGTSGSSPRVVEDLNGADDVTSGVTGNCEVHLLRWQALISQGRVVRLVGTGHRRHGGREPLAARQAETNRLPPKARPAIRTGLSCHHVFMVHPLIRPSSAYASTRPFREMTRPQRAVFVRSGIGPTRSVFAALSDCGLSRCECRREPTWTLIFGRPRYLNRRNSSCHPLPRGFRRAGVKVTITWVTVCGAGGGVHGGHRSKSCRLHATLCSFPLFGQVPFP